MRVLQLPETPVRSSYEKNVLDLRFFRGGVKAWNEKHKAKSLTCDACGHIHYPAAYLAEGGEHRRGRPPIGKNLGLWCVYNKIALSQSYAQIATAVEDIFGLSCSKTAVATAMESAAKRYRSTYLAIVENLRNSTVVHADETWVSVTGSSKPRGYVWAFANMENAAYVYSQTREGATPRSLLEGFNGVLVSDFYSAYESLDCVQQKCLIHLIRDMNRDLFKHQFDEEFIIGGSSAPQTYSVGRGGGEHRPQFASTSSCVGWTNRSGLTCCPTAGGDMDLCRFVQAGCESRRERSTGNSSGRV